MPIAPARESDRQPIVIAGAGIGGLTAALALAAVGFRVVVAERAEALSEIGAGIQIGPNAGRVLARLGLGPAMSAASVEPRAISVHSGASGKLLTSIPASAFRQRYGFPYQVIRRADLQSILADAASRSSAITLHLGATVQEPVALADGLSVHVARSNGSKTIDAAALIAADGVRSSLRELLPGAARAKPAGRTAWRALVPADTASSFVDAACVGLWLGRAAHLVHYPIAQGTTVNIVAVIEDAWDQPGWNAPGDPEELTRRFESWCAPARALLAAPEAWQKFALAGVDPTGPWVADRIALLGDAAHAMMPFLAQGAAMAIEDAAVLAHSLSTVSDVPAALSAYEAARRSRVARVWEAARRTGDIYHFGAALAAARDAALSVAGPRLVLGTNDWIYRWLPPEPGTAMRAASAGR